MCEVDVVEEEDDEVDDIVRVGFGSKVVRTATARFITVINSIESQHVKRKRAKQWFNQRQNCCSGSSAHRGANAITIKSTWCAYTRRV